MESRSSHAFLVGAVSAAVAFGVVALAIPKLKAWTALGLVLACLIAAAVFLVIIYRDRPRLSIGHPSVWEIAITKGFEPLWSSTAFHTSDVYGGAVSAGPSEIDHA